MFERLLKNHVLANLTFVLVLIIGTFAYYSLPRQQDPSINFNWIMISTVLPGASAMDVEKKITDPLEDAVRTVQDIKFVASNSRTGISSLLVRFEDIDERSFDKRLNDLRTEIQNAEREFPQAAEDPLILEVTTANAFPAATLAVVAVADGEPLRQQAANIEKDLERIAGVDRVDTIGLADPELQVDFDLQLLEKYRINPSQIADTVAGYFQDTAAGDLKVGEENWLVRIVGSDADPFLLSRRNIVAATEQTRLQDVATVKRGRTEASQVAATEGSPAVILAVMKQAETNTLDLVDRLKVFIDERNQLIASEGVKIILVDDQTIPTRNAIGKMQSNALLGLLFVLIIAWLFLGSRIAFLTAIGIPFVLAGTFWGITLIGETLNVMVLLGVVIVLGMLVDDAVVVVESIYYRLRHGIAAMQAIREALQEVAAPVTAAVLTTMAAFGPLVFLPGILGEFMKIVPTVVVIALAISLLEAFWMLPAHILAFKVNFKSPSAFHRKRIRIIHRIQIFYIRFLIRALRHRWLTLVVVLMMFVSAVFFLVAGWIKIDFFANDAKRVFYVSVEMPSSTPLAQTLSKVQSIEEKVRQHLKPEELRQAVSYGGTMFTIKEPLFGDHLGQVIVGLQPGQPDMRSVDEMIEAMRADIQATAGPVQVSFLKLSSGPPAEKPISIKVRGDDYVQLRKAADDLKRLLAETEGVMDISDDASRGRYELIIKLNEDAISRAQLNPMDITRTVMLMVDGQVVSDMRDAGEKLEVRVRAAEADRLDIARLLDFRFSLADGKQVPLSSLVSIERQLGLGNIRHYNFRRAITVESDLNDQVTDTVTANKMIMQRWQTDFAAGYPSIDLDFTGELDDINESMDSILMLFVFGVGVMYAILGTQFRSYFQPLMILSTLFMAFTGVMYGLWVSGSPMSLYTLYGVVALGGIAVNSAIVLISAGNERLAGGMSILHATIYAARRRVIPILITSLTTIAGLFSLAVGLGGKSLVWGPVANAIVWGLAFSTILTLIVVPLLYRLFMPRSYLLKNNSHQ